MPTYSNGYIPESLLVTFATGWSSTDGNWKHQLSPATYAKHLELVKRSPGGKLAVTPGWGAYRPYQAQVVARRLFGNGAAVPGTSSHGGFWEGRQTLAIDYHNWGSIYGWDQARWFADVRAVGLTPGMIMRSRGYPDEPWHVIDLDPWAAVPAGVGAEPFEPLEEFMGALSDDQQRQMYDALVVNGGQYYKTDAIVNAIRGELIESVVRKELKPLLEAIRNGDVYFPGTNWNAYETLANVSREDAGTLAAILARAGGAVDVAALAAQIREGLGAEVAAELARRLNG